MFGLTVFGDWCAWKRPRFNRARGTVFEDAADRAYRERVRGCFIAECRRRGIPMDDLPLHGAHQPVVVSLTFFRPLPSGRPKRLLSEPDAYKPDLDNLAKAILDALTGLAWVDDAQVVELHVIKADRVRGVSPQVWIEVCGGNPGPCESERKEPNDE